MNTNLTNRKFLWVAGIVLAALYFAPSALQSYRQAAFYRQQMEAVNARMQAQRIGAPYGGTSPATVQAVAANAGTIPPVNTLVGVWQGQQAQANRQLCQLALELRESPPAVFTGYSKLTCWPIVQPQGRDRINGSYVMRSLSPTSAVMTGSLKNGAVVFHVDKTIGASVEGCTITGFTATPFGVDQVAAEWQDGFCGTGQVVLRRTAR
jgi:hypothetical protein